jgi:hypothetical protein
MLKISLICKDFDNPQVISAVNPLNYGYHYGRFILIGSTVYVNMMLSPIHNNNLGWTLSYMYNLSSGWAYAELALYLGQLTAQ